MQQTFECSRCKKLMPVNPRLKGEQKYCGCQACQNERKRIWYRNKLATDSKYAQRQKKCRKHWRKAKPNHKYMNQYRQTHPDYTQRNRDQQQKRNQRLRNKQNKLTPSEKIVNIDPLEIASAQPKVYEMKILTPDASKKIVNIDALLIELSVYQDDKEGTMADCKY